MNPIVAETLGKLGLSPLIQDDIVQNPSLYSQKFEKKIKRLAKEISKNSSIGHSQALDAISNVLWRSNWHELSKYLYVISDDLELEIREKWAAGFFPFFILLIEQPSDDNFPIEQYFALEGFGKDLAGYLRLKRELVLDKIIAKTIGYKSWGEISPNWNAVDKAAILAECIQPSHDDLYSFVIHHDPRGHKEVGLFKASFDCNLLVDELEEFVEYTDMSSMSSNDVENAYKWTRATLGSRPGFLEGGLALATLHLYDGDFVEAIRVSTEFIDKAESLIPPLFKGQISWINKGNRFYLQLLFLQMEAEVLLGKHGDLKKAERIGLKMLKLDPGDRLGVQVFLAGIAK